MMNLTTAFLIVIICFSCTPASRPAASNSQEPKGIIAFTSTRDGNMEIYTVDLETNQTLRITDHEKTDYSCSWSRKGDQLVFYSNRSGNGDIYLVNADGSGLRQLTNDPADDALPEFSPDDKQIAFISRRDKNNRELFIMNMDGSGVTQLTKNNEFEESPGWAPDGSHLIFTREVKEKQDTSTVSNAEIFSLDLKTKSEKRILWKKGFDSGPTYSPDGRRIAFYGEVNRIFDIYLMNADGTDLINLTNDSTECYSPSWSPDGNWIAYTAGNSKNYEVWIINVHTKEKRRVTDSPGRDEKPAWGIRR